MCNRGMVATLMSLKIHLTSQIATLSRSLSSHSFWATDISKLLVSRKLTLSRMSQSILCEDATSFSKMKKHWYPRVYLSSFVRLGKASLFFMTSFILGGWTSFFFQKTSFQPSKFKLVLVIFCIAVGERFECWDVGITKSWLSICLESLQTQIIA